MGGCHPGGDAGSDRRSRWGIRPRVRIHERTGPGARALPAAHAVPRQQRSRTSFPSPRSPIFCSHPGEQFDYDGRRLTYPDIRLVYWAGGNPFHHHQASRPAAPGIDAAGHDRRPRSVLDADGQARGHRRAVHHRRSNATICRARATIRCSSRCRRPHPVSPTPATTTTPSPPSRTDSDSGSSLPRGDVGAVARASVRAVARLRPRRRRRSRTPHRSRNSGVDGHYRMRTEDDLTLFEEFRADPEHNPLRTPSGRIEIFSADHRQLRIRRLRGPSDVVRAGGVARR